MSSENALTAEVQAEGLQFRPAAEGITVLDGKDYQVALTFIQAIKGWIKKVEGVCAEDIKTAYAQHKDLVAQQKGYTQRAKEALSILQQKTTMWMQQKRRKAAEEERKLREAAEEKGLDTSLVQKAAPPPKVDGVSYRKNYSFVVEDFAEVPDEYKLIDRSKVQGMVNSHKGQITIKGLKIFEDTPTQVVKT